MKKKFMFISLIFLVIFVTIGYSIKYKKKIEQYKIAKNQEFKDLYNKDLLGTELVSVMNKALDNNRKVINKDNNKEINQNSNKIVEIDIKFKNLDKNISMEKINEMGIKNFVKNFGSFYFKCNKIVFYEESEQVKYMLFEEI